MELTLEPALAAKVELWSAETGRPAGELVEDAIAGYFSEVEELRNLLRCRYDEIADGRVQPVDGAEAYRQLKNRASQRRKSIA
jgi:hypothetical protein